MFDWNDLRYFLAVARHASLSGASRELGVSQSTVLRRISALEQNVGHQLFDRLPSGYVLMPEGKDMLSLARGVEEQALTLDRVMAGRCDVVGGPLRVATSDVLAEAILERHLLPFCRKYPEVQIELLVGDDYVDLARREADVAFRAGRPDQNALFGRQVTTLSWALYAAGDYVAKHPVGDAPDLADHRFVGLAGKMASIGPAAWYVEHVPASCITYRTNNLMQLNRLLRMGYGLGLLPCVLGDCDAALVPIMPPIRSLDREGWLITHEDLKHNPRVQCFLREIGAAIFAERHIHAGAADGQAPPPLSDSANAALQPAGGPQAG